MCRPYTHMDLQRAIDGFVSQTPGASRQLANEIARYMRREVAAAIDQLREELQMEIHMMQPRAAAPTYDAGPFALEPFVPGDIAHMQPRHVVHNMSSMAAIGAVGRNPSTVDLMDAAMMSPIVIGDKPRSGPIGDKPRSADLESVAMCMGSPTGGLW